LFESAPKSIRDDEAGNNFALSNSNTNEPKKIDDRALTSGCPFAPRCPRATQKCFDELPPIRQLSESHKIRCWN